MAKEPKESVYDNIVTALDALSYDELLKIAEEASKMAEGKKIEAKAALVAEFMERAASLGMKLVEETGRGRKAARKGSDQPRKAPAAYRDGDKVWSGKGPRPAWVHALVDAGKNLADYKVTG